MHPTNCAAAGLLVMSRSKAANRAFKRLLEGKGVVAAGDHARMTDAAASSSASGGEAAPQVMVGNSHEAKILSNVFFYIMKQNYKWSPPKVAPKSCSFSKKFI
jgi:hypothetical protein